MQDQNSNNLRKLINSIKSQEPILPLEEVDDMSKAHFSAGKAWFQKWIKPIGIAAGVVIIALTTLIFVDTSTTNETVEISLPVTIKDNTTNSNRDTLVATKSYDLTVLPSTREVFGEDANLKIIASYSNLKKADKNLKYTLTASDSVVLNGIGATIQKFEIDALRDTMIVGKLGTKLVFYKACFEDINGNIAKTKVRISLKECYDYPDMIKENLNTHSDNGYLESKGMIWVEANSDGKSLELREGFDMPIEFSSNPTEEYNLYYSEGDKYTPSNWQIDSLGKEPTPIIVPISGRYWDVTFNYFIDNYKLNKAALLELQGAQWNFHFTSSKTKMLGYTACISPNTFMNNACLKFRELCKSIYKDVPSIKQSSWQTDFGFICISRDSLYRMLDNDTFQEKVDKEIFKYIIKSPFFATRLGWINCDHPIFTKTNRDNEILKFSDYPKDGYTKTYLLLKNKKTIVVPYANQEHYAFYFLPRKEEAILFSYKLENGKISYFQMDVNTAAEQISLGKYESVKDQEALVEKIIELKRPYLN